MSLRTKIISNTGATEYFWFLIALVVLVAIFYIYSVNRTVVLVAQRNTIETKISNTEGEISKLESSYISEVNNITPELALSLGYAEVNETVYIPRKSVSVLSRQQMVQ